MKFKCTAGIDFGCARCVRLAPIGTEETANLTASTPSRVTYRSTRTIPHLDFVIKSYWSRWIAILEERVGAYGCIAGPGAFVDFRR